VRFRRLSWYLGGGAMCRDSVVVEVLPPCAQPCAEGEVACEANHTCFGSAIEHCYSCLAGSAEQCACWDGSAFVADGTTCSMMVGNTGCSGECQGGVCSDVACFDPLPQY
jgi:hypothetical protein